MLRSTESSREVSRDACLDELGGVEDISLFDGEDELPSVPRSTLFWKQLTPYVVALGLSTWASMPIVFWLAWRGMYPCIYAFVLLKFLISVALQRAICKYVLQHVTKVVGERVPGAAGAYTCEAAVNFAFATFQFLVWSVEALDPDMDAMTPASAAQSFSAQSAAAFDKSWSSVLVAGRIVDYLGLPGVLTVGMVTISLCQLNELRGQIMELYGHMAGTQCDEREVIGQLFHVADCANLLILSSCCKTLQRAMWKNHDAIGIRCAAYRSRVPETLFQSWFTVSAIAFTWNGASDAATVAILASTSTSIMTSLVMLIDMAVKLAPYRRCYERQVRLGHVPGSWHESKFVRTIVFMTVHCIGYVAIIVRLAGVFICARHNYQLSSMTCSG